MKSATPKEHMKEVIAKKIVSFVMIVMLVVSLQSTTVLAAGSATFSLRTSASQVRIGDTITVTGSISASAMMGTFDLSITYPGSQLQYVKAEGISTVIRSGELDVNASSGKIQLLYLDTDGGNSGITSGSAFRITFKVIGGAFGDQIPVGLQVRTAGDANASGMSVSGSGTSMTIAEPLSDNANLSSLSVQTGAQSPSFSKTTTSYSLSVPFDVSKITVSAKAEDETAKINVNSPTLTPGGTTTVTVIVTAASGAKKTYTISVKRAADPNYQASANNNLTGIKLDQAILSPAFSKDHLEYIAYVPYELDKLNITGTPEDSKSTVSVESAESLQVDTNNLIKVICTAENGTVKTYTVVVRRAAAFSGLATLNQPLPTSSPSPAISQPAETTKALTSKSTDISSPTTVQAGPSNSSNAQKSGTDTAKLIMLALILAVALGEAGYIFYLKEYKGR